MSLLHSPPHMNNYFIANGGKDLQFLTRINITSHLPAAAPCPGLRVELTRRRSLTVRLSLLCSAWQLVPELLELWSPLLPSGSYRLEADVMGGLRRRRPCVSQESKI